MAKLLIEVHTCSFEQFIGRSYCFHAYWDARLRFTKIGRLIALANMHMGPSITSLLASLHRFLYTNTNSSLFLGCSSTLFHNPMDTLVHTKYYKASKLKFSQKFQS